MHTMEFETWRQRNAELVREAENERLARQLRESGGARGFWNRVSARLGLASTSRRPARIRVRWAVPEDEEKVAELLELNGRPRRLASGEGFVVAEKDGEVLAAVRYRTESKRLLLGLLVADPWTEERPLADALYAGARELARELGVKKVRTRSGRRGRVWI